ncbi:MAG: hypothetical protein ACR2IQ_01860 [Minisyncoccia bacterium]
MNTAFGQTADGSVNTNSTPVYDQPPVTVKNYMPAPVVKVTNPDVRVPVNVTIEYPQPAPVPTKDYDYISPYMIFIVILIAALCVVIGFLIGRNGSSNGVNPVTIHNHGGAGGAGGSASVETHESTTITGPTK